MKCLANGKFLFQHPSLGYVLMDVVMEIDIVSVSIWTTSDRLVKITHNITKTQWFAKGFGLTTLVRAYAWHWEEVEIEASK